MQLLNSAQIAANSKQIAGARANFLADWHAECMDSQPLAAQLYWGNCWLAEAGDGNDYHAQIAIASIMLQMQGLHSPAAWAAAQLNA
jgi:hypothetical protein